MGTLNFSTSNKLQKLEDALVGQMLTGAKCAKSEKIYKICKVLQNVQCCKKLQIFANLCKKGNVLQHVQKVQNCAKCA